MRWYGIDLHVHTVLSPCGDFEMSSKNIVKRAKMLGVEILAITDHHMVENYPAVKYWGDKMDVIVIPGMEIQSREEVHVVGLFENYETALEFQKVIWRYLPIMKNNEDLFGLQVVINEKDEVERIEERLLLTSTSLSLKEVTELIKKYEGLAVLAHIDKPMYSVISNLGFIPDDLNFDVLELSKNCDLNKFSNMYNIKNKPVIISSDAHYLEDMIKPKTFLGMEDFSWKDFVKALKCKNIKYQLEV
ncbi:MAG: histidinol-phosphatase [Dictyoglomus sp. NZ13-RE01]|nr:MAG: histidinol-phosphatase [Dictyoglomus sp. NZ13-RE01]